MISLYKEGVLLNISNFPVFDGMRRSFLVTFIEFEL